MMEKYEIVGVSQYCVEDILRFDGFYLKGVVGAVDPFVDARLNPNDCFDAQVSNSSYPETALPFKEYAKRELEWANSMVGKYLICERLAYRAFAACGEIRFEV